MFAWSIEESGALERMWAEGKSASQIAKALGTKRSRNSVIGRVHRLGLNKADRSSRSTQPNRVTGARIKRKAAIAFVPNSVLKPLKRETLAAELAIIRALPPLGAKLGAATGCRFIPGDPQLDSRVCGRMRVGGSAWCVQHKRLVYTPAAPKAKPRSPERDEHRRWLRDLEAGMSA